MQEKDEAVRENLPLKDRIKLKQQELMTADVISEISETGDSVDFGSVIRGLIDDPYRDLHLIPGVPNPENIQMMQINKDMQLADMLYSAFGSDGMSAVLKAWNEAQERLQNPSPPFPSQFPLGESI